MGGKATVPKVSSSDVGHIMGQFKLRPGTFVAGAIAFAPHDQVLFVNSQAPGRNTGIDVINAANLAYMRTIQAEANGFSDMVVDNSGRFVVASQAGLQDLRVYLTGLGGDQIMPKAKSLLNVSTRLRTQSGDNVLIGGFIISGAEPKKVAIRAKGPSLPLEGKLSDPILELRNHDGTLRAVNDNWNSNRVAAMLTGRSPTDEHEAFIVTTLQPGSYTAIVRGQAHAPSGVVRSELFDLTADSNSKIANISTRGKVEIGDNVMIGGFVIGGDQPTKVIIRAIGPSLSHSNVQGALQDPILELHGTNGALIFQNDNWRTSQPTDIFATRLAPSDNRESAIVATLNRVLTGYRAREKQHDRCCAGRGLQSRTIAAIVIVPWVTPGR